MLDLYALARPFLFMLAPERAHGLTIAAMKRGLMPNFRTDDDAVLAQSLLGLEFANPVGLAAGFDKNAEAMGAAFKMGFGAVEVGTVTPLPQDGNPKPRIFRDAEHEAVINRMGFPNGGLEGFKANMEAFQARSNRPAGVVGLNIGMNKTQTDPALDYGILIASLAPMADYLTINISSPNTPGLRDLQRREPLLALLDVVKNARAKACAGRLPPLLVKLAPDLDEDSQSELAAVALEAEIDGLILGNTTLDRPLGLPERFRAQAGGLSGRPLSDKSTAVIGNFHRLTAGKIPIIGVGGVSSGADAYAKIKAGASLVQLYSALVFKGPCVISKINAELAALLKADGYANISEAVGVAHG